MSAISLKLRVDSLDNWNAAQNDSNGPFGYVTRGELVAGIDVSAGKIIVKVGAGNSPVLFNECPVVFESSLEYTQENVQYILANSLPSENSFLVYEGGVYSLKLISDFLQEINYPEDFIVIPTEDKQNTGLLYWDTEDQKWYILPSVISTLNLLVVPVGFSGGKANDFILVTETANDINPNKTITIKNKTSFNEAVISVIEEEIIERNPDTGKNKGKG
jgi:hypothetical protein